MRCGMSAIVRTLAVTSSPTAPSPRVAASTSTPSLIAQRAAQPVDLGLGGQRHRLVGGQVEEAPHAADELRHFLGGEGIFQAEHRPRMRHLGQARGRRRARPPRDGESARTRCGNCASSAAFSRTSASNSASLNLGRVAVVIGAVVARNVARQPHQPVGRLGLGQIAALMPAGPPSARRCSCCAPCRRERGQFEPRLADALAVENVDHARPECDPLARRRRAPRQHGLGRRSAMKCAITRLGLSSANGLAATTSASSPRCARTAAPACRRMPRPRRRSSPRTAASPSALSNSRLPLAIKVRTLSNPQRSPIAFNSVIGNLPVPATLTARSIAT